MLDFNNCTLNLSTNCIKPIKLV